MEGRVLLKGSVPTPQDRERALGLAKGVAGVREAIDGLQVGEDGGTLGYMQDTWISAQLKSRLTIDLAVLHINYDVETVNGVVYLIGIAQDEKELERVVAHARDVPGVRRVANHVTVKDHPRRLPRVRDRRGRRPQARRGNATSGIPFRSISGAGRSSSPLRPRTRRSCRNHCVREATEESPPTGGAHARIRLWRRFAGGSERR